MRRTILIASVSGILGFGLGFMAQPEPTTQAANTTPIQESLGTSEPAHSTAQVRPADPDDRAYRQDLERRIVALAAEKRSIETSLDELAGALQIERAERAMLEGVAVEKPAVLDPIFEEPGFLRAVQEALESSGVSGEVQSLDCTEYPCIVHGALNIDTPRDDTKLNRLLQQLRTKFPDANYYVSKSVFADDPTSDDPALQRFSMSFYPKETDDARRRALNQRLRARKNQYVDATDDAPESP